MKLSGDSDPMVKTLLIYISGMECSLGVMNLIWDALIKDFSGLSSLQKIKIAIYQ